MDYIGSKDIKSFEEWSELKEGGRVLTTAYISIGTIFVFAIFNTIVNLVILFFSNIRLTIYQYFLVFLIIPLLLGTIYAYASVQIIWKFNALIHNLREVEIEKYKRVYFINNIIGISIMLLSVGIIFDSVHLLKTDLYELIKMGVGVIVSGAIIGYIHSKRNWNMLSERIVEELENFA
ncbi:hypothetical protein [Candidatus Clostridium stratigraminis]|uniref:Uncharacterized protein n=1 Tax=Candidatus Clostridium stratigraminis TaxID=3381661 RepID=A0ABW8T6Q7_9CLOT